MPILANPKHETFAQNCANGLSQIDAYESAGYPRSPSSANALANKEEVRNRITEILRDKQALSDNRQGNDPEAVPEMSFDWLVKMLQRNITLAQTGGQISAANKAIELLAEMHDFIKNKKKTDDPADPNNKKEPTDGLGNLSDVMEKLGHLVPPKKDAAE